MHEWAKNMFWSGETRNKPVEIYIARRNMMLWIMFQSFFLMQYNILQYNTI